MTNYHRDYDILGLQKKQDNTKFAFNFGAGMELMFSPTIGMNLEYIFRVVENWNRSHIALGMVYKF
ncbi:MAG: porin family protein [Bacteroidales bacterium]|nr:porin family protein [Bacteroidales bacterium]